MNKIFRQNNFFLTTLITALIILLTSEILKIYVRSNCSYHLSLLMAFSFNVKSEYFQIHHTTVTCQLLYLHMR